MSEGINKRLFFTSDELPNEIILFPFICLYDLVFSFKNITTYDLVSNNLIIRLNDNLVYLYGYKSNGFSSHNLGGYKDINESVSTLLVDLAPFR